MLSKHLDERTKGSSGLSIGTHLALESLGSLKLEPYDPDREIPKVELEEYSYHVFNLYTITRNIKNAILYKDRKLPIKSSELLDVVDDEIRTIEQLYKGKKVKVIWYCPDYNIPIKEYNKGKQEPNTNPYRDFLVDEQFLSKNFNTFNKLKLKYGNEKKSYKLDKIKGKGLITTHISLDLFNDSKLYLLESHTGRLLTPEQRSLRYRRMGDVEYKDIPYIEEIYYILGDKLFVTPCSISDRRVLLDLMVKLKWTRYTGNFLIKKVLRNHITLGKLLDNFKSIY